MARVCRLPYADRMAATELWLVRHGESVANVAAAAADAAQHERIVVAFRDADVPLSPTGERQAEALGEWLEAQADADADPDPDAETQAQSRGHGRGGRPGSVWVSPYLRARQTVSLALARAGRAEPIGLAGPADPPRVDERLRDRELGILDLLTSHGVDTLLPDEAARRRWLGKFYYRPPGGESWADVALRVRSLLGDLDRAADAQPGQPILIVAHDAVVMVFVYVCIGLSETELLEFARTHTVTNASVTKLVRPSGSGLWMLDLFSHDEHLEASGVPITMHSGDTRADIL
jgi:broad specificity phosphatase PhoE